MDSGDRVQAAVPSVDDKIRFSGFAFPDPPISRDALEAVGEANVPSGRDGWINPQFLEVTGWGQDPVWDIENMTRKDPKPPWAGTGHPREPGTGEGDSDRTALRVVEGPPAAYFTIVCFGFWNNFVQTGKWTSLLWMFSEGMVILLLVFRRESRQLSRRPWDWIVALGGSFSVLLVRPAAAIAPEFLGVLLLFAEPCSRSTRRSFSGGASESWPPTGDRNEGAVPHRPPPHLPRVFCLPYRIPAGQLESPQHHHLHRHCFFQISRILAEERILREDESYRAYCQRVRYRVIPLIF